MSNMTPREIVQELDKHIIGQQDAKRAVAIALRNRWRRSQLSEELRSEITPKNIIIPIEKAINRFAFFFCASDVIIINNI